MSYAFIFPGQGSQKIGMGKELFDQSQAARAVLQEVDDALDQPLSKLIFDGEQKDLTLTENAQPALMAVSLAVVKTLEQEFDIKVATSAHYVAGHSLGEYSALAAAGALTIADTAKLLRLRGQSMQKAVPVGEGAMAAILGVELEQAEALAQKAAGDDVCSAANDNAPGQIVISGSRPAVERAVELASEFGARRAILLDVSAPFHCSLMQPAQDIMAKALNNASISDPCVPLIANVKAKPIVQAQEVRDCLIAQVTGRVRWRESVSELAGLGVTSLCELGSGKILSSMTRRIVRELDSKNAETMEEIEVLANELKSA